MSILRSSAVVWIALGVCACASSDAVFEAAKGGYAQEVRSLLQNGANPNAALAGGWTPLMVAAAEGHRDTVRVLLDARANPNARNSMGRTALMFAASAGHEPIVSGLIAAGAEVNPVDEMYGQSALMLAAGKGHLGTVRMLLQGGADRSLHDREGNTARDLARAAGNKDIANLLDTPSHVSVKP